MLLGILIGLIIGIFVPAPYDEIGKTFLKNVWNTVSGWFKS